VVRVRSVTSQWRRETRVFSSGQSRSTMKRSADWGGGGNEGVLMLGVLDISGVGG
jgi:hypothetical protein